MENENDDENFEPTPKKMKSEWSKSYSNKAMQMMLQMGYEADKGLGKQNQGRLEPIIAVQQDGRRGLGLKVDITASKEWDPACEEIELPEKIEWIRNSTACDSDYEELKKEMRTGERKKSVSDETMFCDAEILNNILKAKTVFDDLNDNEMRRARSRCNPFETIRSSIFLNRAAVKMANIDSMCDYMFTNPKHKSGTPLLHANELLYFADICAGPGGFSEYILYRKSWEAKGFGFTLRGPNDFKLDKFFAGSPESFDPYYGIKDDGDVFDEGNQDSFADYVKKHCIGVHFVMADGGFSVEGQENIQEILSKQLYLCQCLTALKILRENGSFVCKLFDLFTSFSVGLVYLMYKCFDQIAIIKPNSSRPANSERYLVCKWKHPDTTEICRYMNAVNRLLNDADLNADADDVLELVSFETMSQDEEFMNYITESNNAIGKNQIIGLKKIAAFCQNPQLKETRQSEFRKRCLELWNLPDTLRQAPDVKSTELFIQEILKDWGKSLLGMPACEICSPDSLNKQIKSIYDWYFMPIGRGEKKINACSMFLCKSRNSLLRYSEHKKWEPVVCIFEVAPKSLFFGEIVDEYNGEGRTLTCVYGLHIIDAIMLGGIDIRRERLCDRLKMCEKYSLSLNKPYKETKGGSIRSKQLYKLTNIDEFFSEMRLYTLKNNSHRLGFSLNKDGRFFVPGGILIFCEIFQNFYSNMSKSRGIPYYFEKTSHSSYYKDDMPPDILSTLYASFRNSFSRRLLWKWTNPTQVEENSNKVESNLLYRDDLKKFIIKESNK